MPATTINEPLSRTPYADVPDVNMLLPFVATFTSTSVPNATQVYNMAMLASNELDAVITDLYQTPIPTSATHTLELLRTYAAIGGAMYTAYSMPQGKDSLHASALERQWQVILSGIKTGKMVLPDAPKDVENTGVRFGEDPLAEGASAYFTRSEVGDL